MISDYQKEGGDRRVEFNLKKPHSDVVDHVVHRVTKRSCYLSSTIEKYINITTE